MPEVPQRTIVNNHVASARDSASKISDPDLRAAVTALVEVGSAITHQIRDADDTIATVLKPVIEDGMADLNVTLNALPSAEDLTNAIKAASGKRGLFN